MNALWLKKAYNTLNEIYVKRLVQKKNNLEKYSKLEEFCKNKHRCFVIGNGPSLNAGDLDKLKGEFTFVCNRFFNIYDGWQPTVYCCQDPTVMKNNLQQIDAYQADFKLLNPHLRIKGSACRDAILYYVKRSPYFNGKPPYMATEFEQGLCDGYTVTFSMLQLAVLLGFKEIYLLGVDFNYVVKDGKIDESSYPKGAAKTGGGGLPNLNYNLQAYTAAAEFCQAHGIKLVNASRQTKLEAIPRADLDEILSPTVALH